MKVAIPVDQRMSRLVRLTVALIAVVALGGIAVAGVSAAFNSFISSRYTPALETASDLRLTMRWAQSDLRLYHDTKNVALVTEMRNLRAESTSSLARVDATLGSDDSFDDPMGRVKDSMTSWWAKATDLRNAVDAGKPADITDPVASFDAFDSASSDLVDKLTARRNDLRDARDLCTLGGLLLTVLVGAWAVYRVRTVAAQTSAAIVEPLRRLDDVVDRQRKGDVDARADTDLGPSEVRNLSTAFNRLLDEEARQRDQQERLSRAQAMALRGSQVLREAATLSDASELLAETVGDGLDGTACRVEFRGVTDALVTHTWVDREGPLASATDDEVAALASVTALKSGVTSTSTTTDDRRLLAAPIRIGHDHFGAVAVIREADARDWDPVEIAMVEQIAAALARSVFERIAHHTQREHLADLRELDRQKNAFISTVSHELRTPLASIAGYTEMLGDGDAGELTRPQKSMIDVIDRNSRRLKGLIEDLLILNRIESSNLRVERREVDVAGLAREVAEDFLPAASAKRIELVVDADRTAVISGDADHLHRALSNLVSNAIKFTPDGGHVSLAVRESAGGVVVEVTDDGMGVPEEQQARLFDRFFRASNAQLAEIQGTGLGLSIVSAIAEGHRGTLECSSTEGEGSTFRLALPSSSAGF